MRMIIALDLDRLIGRSDGSLPWRLPGDLKRFKALTMGHAIIVGRKTAETLPKLPGRTVLVASRLAQPNETTGALAPLCAVNPNAWICGGAQIYRAALEMGVVTEVYATRVMRHSTPVYFSSGDAYAPQWEDDFTLTSVELGADPNTVYEHWRRA